MDLFFRYRRVESQLTPERWVTSLGGFTFGVPWPWEELAPENIEGLGSDPLLAAVAAPRASGPAAMFIVTAVTGHQGGLVNIDTNSMLSAFAQQYGTRPERVRKILLGGVRSELLVTALPRELVHQLLTERSGTVLQGLLRAPRPGYLHHFDLMLATWTWT